MRSQEMTAFSIQGMLERHQGNHRATPVSMPLTLAEWEGILEALRASPPEAEGRWIPVSERVPEEWACVLVYNSNTGRAQYAHRGDEWAGGFTTASNKDEGGMAVDGITHWMPLP